MTEIQEYWFAARTRDKQEFSVRNFIEKLRTAENLAVDYFLPIKVVTRQLKYRRKRVEVPIIKNLIFIRATKQSACDLSNRYGVPLFYMKDLLTRAMLVVPNKQMDDFMFLMNLDPEGVCLDNENLSVGSKVKVVKGDFSGIEGEVATAANKSFVVIRIESILTASVRVPKSYLKIIEE